MGRIIGIRHRVKRSASGEARPTQLCVMDPSRGASAKPITYDLETETDELDWVRGQYPMSWRNATPADRSTIEDITRAGRIHHLRSRPLKADENVRAMGAEFIIERQVLKDKEIWSVLQIPKAVDGLMEGDTVAMTLGGSGDRLAFALSRRADELGDHTRILRTPPARLLSQRSNGGSEGKDKTDDAAQLAAMVQGRPEDFYLTTRRDRDLIRLTEVWRNRVAAMKARIGAEQRLRSALIGKIFCSEEGLYPEGEIELLYDRQCVNDQIIDALVGEEALRDREVAQALRHLAVYERLFEPIPGIGPMIAARIIVAVGDIRRFETESKFKAFMGVHVMAGRGHTDVPVSHQFPRKRSGEVANWHPDGRQALYLLAEQFNRRPETEWGKRLREVKVKFRATHPVVECGACGVPWDDCPTPKSKEHTRRYTDGHIHKMALWRCMTKFAEWLYKEWWRIEKEVVS